MHWKRLWHYEFWPFWLFYIPAYFYYFFLAIKAKRWVYFSVLNPCMNYAGAFLTSKQRYLSKLPNKWVPKQILVYPKTSVSEIVAQLNKKQLFYPLIAKPDMGERGKNVEKLNTVEDLIRYVKTNNQPFLIQEFIDYPIELGILFYWDIDGTPIISSIGKKEFCSVTGDGKSTLEMLVSENIRVKHRLQKIRDKFKQKWMEIVPTGQDILIEPIGNHNRGTKFLDAREIYSNEMLSWMSSCLSNLKGFDYGRVDLKISDLMSFKKNEGIKIMEINGVNSEPIHIYDPKYSIRNAYKDIFHHMRIIFKLSQNKVKPNSPTITIAEFLENGIKVFAK